MTGAQKDKDLEPRQAEPIQTDRGYKGPLGAVGALSGLICLGGLAPFQLLLGPIVWSYILNEAVVSETSSIPQHDMVEYFDPFIVAVPPIDV